MKLLIPLLMGVTFYGCLLFVLIEPPEIPDPIDCPSVKCGGECVMWSDTGNC